MRILAIEIGDGELRAARALRTFGSARLAGVERIPFADASELRAALERLAAWHPQVVVALAPAALVTHRILTLPFGSRRRVAATLPLELLGQLPAAPEDPVIAFEPLAHTEAGTVVLAAAARRAELEASIEPLVAAGLPPARVELAPIAVWSLMPDAAGDAAIVVADGERSALSVRRGGRIVGLRALGTPATEPVALAAEVRWVLAALGGAPPTIVATGADRARIAAALDARPLADVDDACAAVAGAATGGRHGVAFDLGLRPSGASLRRVAALAVVAVALACLDLGLARYDLARRDAALVAAIERTAAEAMPGTRLVAPRAQLEAAVGGAVRQRTRLGGGTTVLEILREVSTRVPPSVSLDLDQLTIEGERLDLRGHAASFDTVDVLRRALASAPFLSDVTADETRATVDGRGVEFRLHAARRPSGASS